MISVLTIVVIKFEIIRANSDITGIHIIIIRLLRYYKVNDV